ncbi:unnamed protein product [Hapterophycus canaliculatus]
MLAFGLRDISDDSGSNDNTGDAKGVRYDSGKTGERAGSPAGGIAGGSCAPPAESPAVSVSGSGSGSGSGGAWSSCLSSARGLTPSSLVPLGPLLDWEGGNTGGGGGSGGGGGGGGATNMSASLAGFAGYRSALLEARRAAVAEDQVEFWQRRACAAEKVVKEQKMKIMELMQRCASLSTPSTATPAPDGGSCSKEASSVLTGGGPRSSPAVTQHQQPQQYRQGGAGRGRLGTAKDEITEVGGDPAVAVAAAGKEEEGGVDTALTAIGGIAFTRFSVGQVSMFFPTPEGNFLAFNVGCPGHFLSKESQALVGKDEHFRPYYVLGRIIEIQDEVCEEGSPYGLPIGLRIKVVFVETITPDLHAAGVISSK